MMAKVPNMYEQFKSYSKCHIITVSIEHVEYMLLIHELLGIVQPHALVSNMINLLCWWVAF